MAGEDDTNTLLRRRFHELGAQAAAIRAQSASARASYESLAKQQQALQAQMDVLADQFKLIEAPLYDIDNQRGKLVRALDGQTGEPPT